MSTTTDHSIVYDLTMSDNGRMECHAPADSSCHAVWDCDCESIWDYHVKDGLPRHYESVNTRPDSPHVGTFDPEFCNLREWHDNLDDNVHGTIRVYVEPQGEADYVEFCAVDAKVEDR